MKFVASLSVLFMTVTSLCFLLDLPTNVSSFTTSRKIYELQQRNFAKSIITSSSSLSSYYKPYNQQKQYQCRRTCIIVAHAPLSSTAPAPTGFIDTELRGAAMRLHTKMQAPNEGQVEVTKEEREASKYVPTRADYLQFLVDSQFVYQTMEDIVNDHEELTAAFGSTGLERTQALETDIAFMVQEYNLERPDVGSKGRDYAKLLQTIATKEDYFVPEFVCHYYNYYFAHTAGGRMIGKQMSALLLDKKTLEFYKVRP